jgi:hypothetical protein
MKDGYKVYKALFVRASTHKKVAVKAKQKGLTIDEYILSVIKS